MVATRNPRTGQVQRDKAAGSAYPETTKPIPASTTNLSSNSLGWSLVQTAGRKNSPQSQRSPAPAPSAPAPTELSLPSQPEETTPAAAQTTIAASTPLPNGTKGLVSANQFEALSDAEDTELGNDVMSLDDPEAETTFKGTPAAGTNTIVLQEPTSLEDPKNAQASTPLSAIGNNATAASNSTMDVDTSRSTPVVRSHA
jgi:hypothetical protein